MNIQDISFGKTEEECKEKGFNYLCKENGNFIGSCCNTECDKRGDELNGFCKIEKIEKIENIRENYENNNVKKRKQKKQINSLNLTICFLKILIVLLLISTIIFGLSNCKNI